MRVVTLFAGLLAALMTMVAVAPVSAQLYDYQEKPFSYYREESPVSPYLNLFRDDSDGISNYWTLVKPQLEQQRLNQQQQRINEQQRRVSIRQQQQLQSIAVQYRNRDQGQIRPTGTPGGLPASARFMNYGHYYGGGR